jgi:hypothetical protein
VQQSLLWLISRAYSILRTAQIDSRFNILIQSQTQIPLQQGWLTEADQEFRKSYHREFSSIVQGEIKMRLGLFALFVLGAALALATPSSAQIANFVGHWENTNMHTKGIVTVEIHDTGSNNVSVHAWGACTPTPCDWGDAEAYAYAPDVSSSIEQSANSITAVVTNSFSVTILLIRPKDTNNVTITAYTRFTDGTGRSDFREEGVFHRNDRHRLLAR